MQRVRHSQFALCAEYAPTRPEGASASSNDSKLVAAHAGDRISGNRNLPVRPAGCSPAYGAVNSCVPGDAARHVSCILPFGGASCSLELEQRSPDSQVAAERNLVIACWCVQCSVAGDLALYSRGCDHHCRFSVCPGLLHSP